MTSQTELLSNPFPGLRPFEFHENHLFFGREGQSDELLKRLRISRFLAVVGTSGSGKSSLVRAGLLPALHSGFMTKAGSKWRVALLRPGNDPIGNLAAALGAGDVIGSRGEDAEIHRSVIEANLRRSALGLIESARQARLPPRENLLVVVDQFEELFRFKQSLPGENPEEEASAFVKLLLEASRQKEAPIYVVLTMRSDYLGDCARFRDLPELINEGIYLIPRMTRDQRREAITRPVAVGGGEISPRLVNRVLNDVGDNPDQLPILQHALMRTWNYWVEEHRDSEPLDLRHYEAIGAMAEALSRHADKAYNELPDDRSREVAEKLFKCLTEKGADNREIRRPTKLEDICSITGAGEEEVAAVIEQFRRPGRSFLMPPSEAPLNGQSLIDISHESLIRGWRRLKGWVEGEALSAAIYHRVAETAALHKENQAGLWRDPDLQVALGWRDKTQPNKVWAERYHPEFKAAMDFLDESREMRDAETLEKERKRKSDLRRTRLFSIFLAVAFLLSSAAGIYAFKARDNAEAALKMAKEQRLLAIRKQGETEEALIKARRSEEQAQIAERGALEQKAIAEQKQREAEENRRLAEAQAAAARRAEGQARDAKEKAEKLTDHIRREAIRLRKQNLRIYSNIVGMAGRLIELSPVQEATIWRNAKASALSQIGDHKGALREYTYTLESAPDNSGARLSRSYEYLIQGQAEKSIEDLEYYLKTDNHSYIAHLNMGHNLGLLGRYDEAAESVLRAIKATENQTGDNNQSDISPDIRQAVGYETLSVDRYSARNAFYYELVNLQAYSGGAGFEKSLDEADRRFTALDEVFYALNWSWLHLKRRAQDYGAFASQGALWERTGLEEWAVRSYARFLREHKKQSDSRYNKLALWVEERMRKINPPGSPPVDIDPPVEAPDALTLAIESQEALTRDWLANGDESDSTEDSDGHRSRVSELHERLNQAIEAEHGKEQTNLPSPNSGLSKAERAGTLMELLTQRISVRLELHDYIGMKEDCNLILERNPNLAFAYLRRALSNIKGNLGTEEELKADLQKAVEFDPVDGLALIYLSDRIAKEDRDKALDLLEQSKRANLHYTWLPFVQYRIAKLNNERGDYSRALDSIKVAIDLKGDELEFYDERAKSETNLKMPAAETTRTLAAGYARAGDILFQSREKAGDAKLKQAKLRKTFDAYWRSLETLSRIEKGAADAQVRNDIASVISKISGLIELLESKGKAVSFWQNVAQSALMKQHQEALENEINRLSTAR